ncbi:MAG: RNA polymerase sigma-70 factor [Flavobacteriaceae bacterium]|uniref:RNA polymerase sigma-70 factor n=1 Tax=Flagellimonas sp. SN16 TaxID=3415142 RepID=UPI003C518489|nr:RNA polymerase sigma-70 factor [Flavobacteriaceae bacterium]
MGESHTKKASLEELASRIAKSNRDAFNTLFGLLWEPMYTYAASVVMDDSVAKDLVQEVWMDYWQRREELQIVSIKPYLYKAVRYKCYNALRNTKFNETQIEAANAVYVVSEMELEEDVTELTNRIHDTLSSLPSRCQEVFRLSRINNITNKEIAEKLNISQRSVENQISFALRKLRKELSIVKFFSF